MPQKLGYIVSRFPHLPETFILREMVGLEQRGWQVSLYPLITQKQAVVHKDAIRWEARVNRVTFFAPTVWTANLRAFFRSPGRYLGTWFKMVWLNLASPNLLIRALILFPKAVWMSDAMVKEEIGHVHAHYATHPALAAWIIHRLTGIEYSLTIHAHDIFVHKAMLAEKFKEAAFIVAISNFNRDYIAREVGEWVGQKTHVVHCGISPEQYQPKAKSVDPTKGQSFKIISIGSLQPYKGQEVLIRACKHLTDQGFPYHCEIIGDGILRERLEGTIRELGLTDQVTLVGALTQEEVAKRLPEADCYVQPSIITPSGKMEGIPLSIMEAMASGLPVIASNISGIPELVRDRETGYLVPQKDEIALAKQIAYIYAHNQEVQAVIERGRELVLQDFSLTKQIDQLTALYTLKA